MHGRRRSTKTDGSRKCFFFNSKRKEKIKSFHGLANREKRTLGWLEQNRHYKRFLFIANRVKGELSLYNMLKHA